jgi:hypothetical protein
MTAKRKKATAPKGATAALTPLEYLLSVARDESLPMARRQEAAKVVTEYVQDDLIAKIASGKP